jgi:HlyD family secretion protein
LQTDETICSISPSGTLVAECYLSATDIGLIKAGQQARFQIDAFDYNYFGVVTGRVQHIDNDYTVVDNKPVFKVRCRFDHTALHLKNGYTGELKKGLTFQCRFMVARRSLWQLLWDKIDDWLNPSSPVKDQAS